MLKPCSCRPWSSCSPPAGQSRSSFRPIRSIAPRPAQSSPRRRRAPRSTDVKAPLPLAAQGKIFHYALLTASEGGAFKAETANRINKRMRELEAGITGGKWRDLAPACDAAYPVAGKTEVELPSDRFEAQMACEELAEFTSVALEGSEVHFGNELAGYRRMRTELNDAIAPGLRARAGSSREAQTRERDRALAAAAALGSPIPVLDKCLERFK